MSDTVIKERSGSVVILGVFVADAAYRATRQPNMGELFWVPVSHLVREVKARIKPLQLHGAMPRCRLYHDWDRVHSLKWRWKCIRLRVLLHMLIRFQIAKPARRKIGYPYVFELVRETYNRMAHNLSLHADN